MFRPVLQARMRQIAAEEIQAKEGITWVRAWLKARRLTNEDMDAVFAEAYKQATAKYTGSAEEIPPMSAFMPVDDGLYGAIGDGKFLEWLKTFLNSEFGKLLIELIKQLLPLLLAL